MITGLHHVQLAMPPGQEKEAVAFYAGVLGLVQTPKPHHLAARGGCWFVGGSAHIHLGVDADFRPTRKAHPALLTNDLGGMKRRLERSGIPIAVDEPLPGYDRMYITDPFGNRVEILQPAAD